MTRRMLGFIAGLDLPTGQRKTNSGVYAANKSRPRACGMPCKILTHAIDADRNTRLTSYRPRFVTAADFYRVPGRQQDVDSIHQTAGAIGSSRHRSKNFESYSGRAGAMLFHWRSCAGENPRIPSVVSGPKDKRPHEYSTTPGRDRHRANREPAAVRPP